MLGLCMAEPLLVLRDLRAGYGESIVLDGVSIDLAEGGSLAVLGRNGVGKTTLIATIMGCTTVRAGAISWRGHDLARVASHRRARLGIGWVAQEREIFQSLTVEENLTVAARSGGASGHQAGRWTLRAVYELFPRLAERRRNSGTHLSGGEQQMLAIARALMTNPALLLLDEPLEGLAPIIVEELAGAITGMIGQEGTAVVLVEQHAQIALSLTRDVVVLERGIIAHRGRSDALMRDQAALDRLVGLSRGPASAPGVYSRHRSGGDARVKPGHDE
jgi:branched-chain amino acid transport system ATP-binding protein